MRITSRDNSLLRRARAVRDGRDSALIFVEGLRLCEEALSSGLKIEATIYSEELAQKPRAAVLINELAKATEKLAPVSERLLESISFTKTPQGIVLLAQRPANNSTVLSSKLPEDALLVILHKVNNPINVGAIIRTAEAAGSAGIITTRGTADPFSPKALRGAMGSAFRLPIWSGAIYEEVLKWCSSRRVTRVCADLHGSKLYNEIDWTGRAALIVGPESSGLTAEEVSEADEAARIPMSGAAESLNVAVAAGVLLYEARRQRELKRVR